MSAKPIRLTDPLITFGTTATGPPATVAQEFVCFSNGIHITGDPDDDFATFCDPDGFAYTLTVDLKMSLGADSLDEALQSLGGPGTVVPFEFAYTPDPASADNPHWSGKVRLSAYPIVDAGINEATSFSMEMPVIGDIVRDDGSGVLQVVGRSSHTHSRTNTLVDA